MMSSVIIAVIILLITLILKKLLNGPKRLDGIPGPKGIPWLGNTLQVDFKRCHEWLTNELKKYGNVMQLNILGTNMVVVAGKEEMKQILVTKGNDFSGRPQTFRSTVAYPNFWALEDYTRKNREQKKIVMNFMKAYGSGLDDVEKLVMQSATELISILRNKGPDPFQITDVIRSTLVSMVYQLQFHKSPSPEEQKMLEDVAELSERIFQVGGEGTLLDMFPWIRFIKSSIWTEFKELSRIEETLFKRWKETYLKSSGSNETIIEILYNNREKSSFKIDDLSIIRSIITIFIGGTSTTTVLLSSLLNRLAQEPSIQECLYKENKKVLGKRNVSLKDKENMPYHEATLYEASRYYTIAPLMLPHKAVVDTSINDVKIPKGTEVWLNLYAYSHDESWGDPFVFRPERFFDENGQIDKDSSESRYFFFSAGPRVCPGEVFAKSRLFLLLSTLIQNFEILPATTIAEQTSCDIRDSVVEHLLHPEEFQIRLKPRE